MKDLLRSLEKKGLQELSSYLNTGNIFFTSEENPESIKSQIEQVIKQEFQLNIPTLIINENNIRDILLALPPDWENTSEVKSNCMFLWEKYNSADVIDKLHISPELDTVIYTNGALLWKTKKADFNRSGMSKLVGTDIYKHMTVRNCNTLRKI